MFWARKGGRLAATLAAASAIVGALALATPAQAGVVVKSSGPSAGEYPVGRKLDDNDRITLRDGDSVTILSTQGTRALSGAGTYRVGARGGATRVKMANLTRQGSAARVRTGAARAGSGEVRSPNLWFVDVTRSGTMCVPDLGAVTLWRPDTKGAATFMVSAAGTAHHYHVDFADGVMEMPVDPERLTVLPETRYAISGPGGAASTVEFVTIEAVSQDPEVLAQQLIDKGCTGQLDLLSQSLVAGSS